jgi:hypothetical protein
MTPKTRWSQHVTETSDAMTLEPGVFKHEPAAIARSLKRSAERSHRRKSSPFRSAMSMLTFYENRAGDTLSAARKRKIEAAKSELRKLYGKADGTTPAKQPRKRTAAKKRSTKRKTRSSKRKITHRARKRA